MPGPRGRPRGCTGRLFEVMTFGTKFLVVGRSVALKVAKSRSRSVVLKVQRKSKVPIATDRDRDCSDLCCDKVRGTRRHRRLDSEVKDPACFNL